MITYSALGRMGWLGNTLFQIATTVVHAKNMNTTSGFPKWMYQNGFEKSLPFISTFPYEKFIEDGFHYTEIPQKNDIDLIGHFQSYKYFDKYYNDVVDLFEFKNDIQEKIDSNNFKFLRDNICCSVHVRRGDYIKYKDHHPMIPLDYYKETTDYFDKDTLFLVFSNEIEWCKENLKSLNKRFIYIDYNNQPVELAIMSKCHHHIMANSSFSWWGAYLCNNKDKIVFAPTPWFGPAYSSWDTKDLLMDTWRQISWKK